MNRPGHCVIDKYEGDVINLQQCPLVSTTHPSFSSFFRSFMFFILSMHCKATYKIQSNDYYFPCNTLYLKGHDLMFCWHFFKIPIWFSQNWGKKNMSPQQHSQFTHIWFVIWYSSSSSLQNIPISRYLVLRLIPRVPFPTLPHWCDYYMVSSSALALLPKEI